MLAAALALASVAVHAQATEGPDGLSLHLASTAADLSATEYLAAARVGARIVAVGEHGTIALSDDGKSWRQARHVPVQSTLTSVAFSDAMHGWAVGHWGVVIHTDDGGETWSLQRSDLKVDQPLFSVYFKNSTEGFAVGLWSLLLKTSDGGRTWTQSKLVSGKKEGADKNLFQLFSSRDGTLYISAEKGTVFCSTNAGATWTGIPTGYSGSLWTGVALSDGALLVGGAPWLHAALRRRRENLVAAQDRYVEFHHGHRTDAEPRGNRRWARWGNPAKQRQRTTLSEDGGTGQSQLHRSGREVGWTTGVLHGSRHRDRPLNRTRYGGVSHV